VTTIVDGNRIPGSVPDWAPPEDLVLVELVRPGGAGVRVSLIERGNRTGRMLEERDRNLDAPHPDEDIFEISNSIVADAGYRRIEPWFAVNGGGDVTVFSALTGHAAYNYASARVARVGEDVAP
jgi:hypothetical protein